MKRKFLGDLLKSDIKKIRVVEHKNDIIIKKTTQPLLPFDGVYGEGSLKTTKDDSNPKTVPGNVLHFYAAYVLSFLPKQICSSK